MNNPLPSQLLEAQHRKIDQGVQNILDGGEDFPLPRGTLELLRLHLYVEEEIMFPAIATPALAMPLYIMKYEHGRIWDFMERLAGDGRGAASARVQLHEDSRKLLILFQRHNPKEEDLIYAAADRVAGENAQLSLVSGIRSAKVPEGWLCMAKRESFAPPPGAPPWRPDPLPR